MAASSSRQPNYVTYSTSARTQLSSRGGSTIAAGAHRYNNTKWEGHTKHINTTNIYNLHSQPIQNI